MIIGTILDDGTSTSTPGDTSFDGYAAVTFYTMEDAEKWAVLQSGGVTVGAYTQYYLVSVINTSNNSKRWWYNGTEYTG
jgi:hypothetical protein